jgi:preprotein translocase subunit SecE
MDGVLALIAALAVAAGLWVFYALSTLANGLRIGAVIAGLLVGVGVLLMTRWGREFIEFAKTARVELRKMVWPAMEDARRMTLVVFASTAFMAIFFWLADFVFSHVTRYLLGTGS